MARSHTTAAGLAALLLFTLFPSPAFAQGVADGRQAPPPGMYRLREVSGRPLPMQLDVELAAVAGPLRHACPNGTQKAELLAATLAITTEWEVYETRRIRVTDSVRVTCVGERAPRISTLRPFPGNETGTIGMMEGEEAVLDFERGFYRARFAEHGRVLRLQPSSELDQDLWPSTWERVDEGSSRAAARPGAAQLPATTASAPLGSSSFTWRGDFDGDGREDEARLAGADRMLEVALAGGRRELLGPADGMQVSIIRKGTTVRGLDGRSLRLERGDALRVAPGGDPADFTVYHFAGGWRAWSPAGL